MGGVKVSMQDVLPAVSMPTTDRLRRIQVTALLREVHRFPGLAVSPSRFRVFWAISAAGHPVWGHRGTYAWPARPRFR